MDNNWIYHPFTQTTSVILLYLFLVFIFQKLFIFFYKRFLSRLLTNNDRKFSLFFSDSSFIFWLTLIPTPVYLYFGVTSIPNLTAHAIDIIQRFIIAFLIWTGLRTLSHFLRICEVIYRRLPMAASKPIKGYLQTVSLVAHFIGIVSIIAILLDKSPLVFLSGLGALTAILLLVFKDSILSLVAGIQITTNDLIRVGDWIEMPQFNADGAVIDIALHTVKVQNWDKTITVIPAHKFLENSFKNWRGMQESGGRRIKRSILIDVKSIRFLTEEDIERFKKYNLLKDYIDQKELEISDHNNKFDLESRKYSANTRRLTNVGTFRNYLSFYLKNNPFIHKEHTFLVRQLEPRPEGLPIEIYVFTNDTRWAYYEEIQANIFDHVLAVMPEFDLRFFQSPSGYDFETLRTHTQN